MAFFSEQTREILQGAARKAGELGRREVDTEHLLYALMDVEVVQDSSKRTARYATDR